MRTIEIDGQQNGRLGILDLMVASELADDYSEAASMVVSGDVILGNDKITDPTIYPNLIGAGILSVRKLAQWVSVVFDLTGPLRIPVTA